MKKRRGRKVLSIGRPWIAAAVLAACMAAPAQAQTWLEVSPDPAEIVLVPSGALAVELVRRGTNPGDLLAPATVTLTSLDTNVFTVPSPVLMAGSATATAITNPVTLTGVAAGTAQLSAAAAGHASSLSDVLVFSSIALGLPANVLMTAGDNAVVTLERLAPATNAISVTVSRPAADPRIWVQGDSGVPAISDTVFIPAGAYSATFLVLGTLPTEPDSIPVVASTPGYLSATTLVTVAPVPPGPAFADDDTDGIADWWEVLYFGDLITVGIEGQPTNVLADLGQAFVDGYTDFDGGGLNDYYEYLSGSDPTFASILDHYTDPDGDWFYTIEEQWVGTLPDVADTDDDGVDDLAESAFGLDPVDSLEEFTWRTLQMPFVSSVVYFYDQAESLLFDFTATAWVNPAVTNGGIVLQKVRDDGQINFELGLDAMNRPYLAFNRTFGPMRVELVNAGPGLPTNAWSFVAVSRDSATSELKVTSWIQEGGTFIRYSTTALNFLSPAAGTGQTLLGGNSQTLVGEYDEVRVWDRWMSDEEIEDTYRRTIDWTEIEAGQMDDLFAYYRFDDDGTTVEDYTHPVITSTNPIVRYFAGRRYFGTMAGGATFNDNAGAVGTGGNDLDGDGIDDSWELRYFGDLLTTDGTIDSDSDGLNDYYEFLSDTNPLDGDTDNDGIGDALEDADSDGLTNGAEQTLGTHPGKRDTDDDGYSDFVEIRNDHPATNDVYGFRELNSGALYPYSPRIDRSLVLDGNALVLPTALRGDPEAEVSQAINTGITIDAPLDGAEPSVLFTNVSGSVSTNLGLTEVVVEVNGREYIAPLDRQTALDDDGNPIGLPGTEIFDTNGVVTGFADFLEEDVFDIEVGLEPGLNTIRVHDLGDNFQDVVTIETFLDEVGLRVVLLKDDPYDVLDLYITDPDGVTEVIRLDDTVGLYGPLIYEIDAANLVPGDYTVRVNYFEDEREQTRPSATIYLMAEFEDTIAKTFQFLKANRGDGFTPSTDPNIAFDDNLSELSWWTVEILPYDAQSGFDFSAATGLGIARSKVPVQDATPGWTAEFWIYPADAAQTGAVLEIRADNGLLAMIAGLDGNEPFVRLFTDATGTNWHEARGGALEAAEWSHVSVSYGSQSQTLRLTVNGSPASARQIIEPVLFDRWSSALGLVGIDRAFEDAVFSGGSTLDELRLWAEARSPYQVYRDLRRQIRVDHDALWAYLRFDDGGQNIEDWSHLGEDWLHSGDLRFNIEGVDLSTNDAPGPDGLFGTADDIVGGGVGPDGQNDYVTALRFVVHDGEDDFDLDGLPDWWEEQFFGGSAFGDPDADLEGDGLVNLYEYYAGTNPEDDDSDADGIYDAFEDLDSDGLGNLDEQTYGSDPRLADTDDDGIGDKDEVALGRDPTVAMDPLVDRYLTNDGSTGGFLRLPYDLRNVLGQWTVEAWVRPDALETNGAIVLRRRGGPSAVNYELGLSSSNHPYIGFISAAGQVVRVEAPTPVVADGTNWTHLAGVFEERDTVLSLYVDGLRVGNTVANCRPSDFGGNGPALVRAGEGFSGAIDELRIWSLVRTPAQLNADMLVRLGSQTLGLNAYFNFDDGGTTAQDQTGLYPKDNWNRWIHVAEYAGAAAFTNDVVPHIQPSPHDTDNDGLPDWWEREHFGDLAAGPFDDNDWGVGDGLNHYTEYAVGTDPNTFDSDSDGITDYYEDFDGDGLFNGEEAGPGVGSYPWRYDTDDDGIADGSELSGGSDPADSLSPFFQRALELDGATSSYARVEAISGVENLSLRRFTLEAWINPDSVAAGELIQKVHVRDDGRLITNYVMGVTSSNHLYLIYDSESGLAVTNVFTDVALPTGQWSHVAAVLKGGEHTDWTVPWLGSPARVWRSESVSLYTFVSSTNALGDLIWQQSSSTLPASGIPARGLGDLTIGRGFAGRLDEARVWATARESEEIAGHRGVTLIGDETGLSAYYRFDDGEWTDAVPTPPTVTAWGGIIDEWGPQGAENFVFFDGDAFVRYNLEDDILIVGEPLEDEVGVQLDDVRIRRLGDPHDGYVDGDIVWIDDGDNVYTAGDDTLIAGEPVGDERGEPLGNVAIRRNSGDDTGYAAGDDVWIDDVDLFEDLFTRRLDWDYAARLVGATSNAVLMVEDDTVPVVSGQLIVLSTPPDLIAGDRGAMTVTRAGGSILDDLVVTIASADSNRVVVVNPTATIPAGAFSAAFDVAGVQPDANGVIIAASAIGFGSAQARVVIGDPNLEPTQNPINALIHQNLFIQMDRGPSDQSDWELAVEAESLDPTVFELTIDNVVMGSNSLSTVFSGLTVGSGSTPVSMTVGSFATNVTVIVAPAALSVSGPDVYITNGFPFIDVVAGDASTISVIRDGGTVVALPVAITNSNPTLVTHSNGLTIATNKTSGSFKITGAGETPVGDPVEVRLSATSYQGTSVWVNVLAPNLTWSPTNIVVQAGDTVPLRISRDPAESGGQLQVDLTGSDETLFTVTPEIALFLPGQNEVVVQVHGTATAEGNGIFDGDLSLSSGSFSTNIDVIVFNGSMLTFEVMNAVDDDADSVPDIVAGDTATLRLRRFGSLASDLDVTLTSLDGDAVSVPAAITIPAGLDAVTFPAAGVSPVELAYIGATATGYASTNVAIEILEPNLVIARAPGLPALSEDDPADIVLQPDEVVTLSIYRPISEVGADLPLDLTEANESPGVFVTTPAQLTIPATVDAMTFDVVGAAIGTNTLIVRAAGVDVASVRIAVQAGLSLVGPASVVVGDVATLFVEASASTQQVAGADVDVSLSTTPSGFLGVPATVFITGTVNAVSFPAEGLRTRTNVTLTASAGGYLSDSVILDVLDPTLSFDRTNYAAEVAIQTEVTLVRPSGEAGGELTVTLNSTDTNVFTVPATATFDSGDDELTFLITGGADTNFIGSNAFLEASVGAYSATPAVVTLSEVRPRILSIRWFDRDFSSTYSALDELEILSSTPMSNSTVSLDEFDLLEAEQGGTVWTPSVAAKWGADSIIAPADAPTNRLYTVILGSEAVLFGGLGVDPTTNVLNAAGEPDDTDPPVPLPLLATGVDSDFDGLPDDWETDHDLDPFDPFGVNGPDGDPDGDGLFNLYEFLAGTDPQVFDSDGDSTSDYDEDSDADNASNGNEQDLYRTNPGAADTDDDGRLDGAELTAGTKPTDSLSPFVFRALRFGGAAGETNEVRVSDRIDGRFTGRFSLSEWTIEATVSPADLPGPGENWPLVSRRTATGDRINYQLGISNGLPYVSFDEALDGTTIVAIGGQPLSTNVWTHLSGRFDENVLTLFVDGQTASSVDVLSQPSLGFGDLVFGSPGFVGDLREMRIWRTGLSSSDIDSFKGATLFFGNASSRAGFMNVSGSGFLKETASTIGPSGDFVDELPNEWTVEAWVRTTGSGTIIARRNGSEATDEDFNYYLGIDDAGRLIGRFAAEYDLFVVPALVGGLSPLPVFDSIVFDFEANNIVGDVNVADGQWHHVAYVRSLDSVKLYVDGVLDAVQAPLLVTAPAIGEARNLRIRSLAGPIIIGEDLAGDIDEARIWNRGLSSADLDEVRDTNISGSEVSLVSYFNFDYQAGAFADDRAAIRDPDTERGVYIGDAVLLENSSQGPPITINPLRTFERIILAGYFSADDGGDTLEDLTHSMGREPFSWEKYAGVLGADVQFVDLAVANYPFAGDSDSDGLPDWWETIHQLDAGSGTGDDGAYGDPDADGLANLYEFLAGTDPNDFDTADDGFGDYDSRAGPGDRTWGELYDDGDGIPGWWEVLYPGPAPETGKAGLSPFTYDATDDPDEDGWSNRSEFLGAGVINDSVQGTDPLDSTDYPLPPIGVHVTYNGQLGSLDQVTGTVTHLSFYMDKWMDGYPVATLEVAGNGVTTNVMTTGHLREGPTWIFGFLDLNGNDTWDEGEPAGVAEDQPISIGWGGVDNIKIPLTDSLPGYGRFEWTSQGTDTDYEIVINRVSQSGAPNVLMRTVKVPRTYFHEGDFRAAGLDGLSSGIYQWWAGTNQLYFDNGFFVVNWPTTLATPTPLAPLGASFVHARNQLSWTMDEQSSTFTIDIAAGGAGEDARVRYTDVVPARDENGDSFLDLAKVPMYAGDVGWTNGIYSWRVRSSNPNHVSAWSSWATFTIDVDDPPAGPSAITGDLLYFGKVIHTFTNGAGTATNLEFIVQAFDSPGFSGLPDAQTRVVYTPGGAGATTGNKGTYQLPGLRQKVYYVRAFVDVDANGVLDPYEPVGFARESLFIDDFEPRPFDLTAAGNILVESADLVIRDRDTDDDNLPDGWEWQFLGTLSYSGDDNIDGGSLSLLEEYALDPIDTNPLLSDTDGDGLEDGFERDFNGSTDYDPFHPVTRPFGTDLNPLVPDTDGDGLLDGFEVDRLMNPLSLDSDLDGMIDPHEIRAKTDPIDPGDFFKVDAVGVDLGLGLGAAVEWSGKAGVVYQVQSSDDLVNWRNSPGLSLLNGVDGPMIYVDPTPAPLNCRFYRVVIP